MITDNDFDFLNNFLFTMSVRLSVQHKSRALNLSQVCLSSVSLLFGSDRAYIYFILLE